MAAGASLRPSGTAYGVVMVLQTDQKVTAMRAVGIALVALAACEPGDSAGGASLDSIRLAVLDSVSIVIDSLRDVIKDDALFVIQRNRRVGSVRVEYARPLGRKISIGIQRRVFLPAGNHSCAVVVHVEGEEGSEDISLGVLEARHLIDALPVIDSISRNWGDGDGTTLYSVPNSELSVGFSVSNGSLTRVLVTSLYIPMTFFASGFLEFASVLERAADAAETCHP